MDYGQIIKRSWTIAWRYKALWVLGIFSGVAGCQPGSSSPNTDYRGYEDAPSPGSFGDLPPFQEIIPLLIVVAVAVFVVWLLWSILSVAAEAGLVHAVNRIERGEERPGVGEAWSVGWRAWGRVFGIRFILGFPMLVYVITVAALLAAAIVEFGTHFWTGSDAFGPILTVLAGVALFSPIMIVVGLFTGVLRLVAVRYAVLGDRRTFAAIHDAWRAFKVRWKDQLIAYLIGGGLNFAASIVFAIPITVLAFGTFLPAVFTMRGDGGFAPLIGALVVFLVLTFLLALLYNGVWGTFTSAYWTLFFREMTSMRTTEPGFQTAPTGGYYGAPYGSPGQPAGYSGYPPPAPGAAPYPPAGPDPAAYPPAAPDAGPYPPAVPPEPQPPAPQPPAPPAPPVVPGSGDEPR